MKRLVNNMNDPLVNVMPLCEFKTYPRFLRSILEQFNIASGTADPFYINRRIVIDAHKKTNGQHIGATFCFVSTMFWL